MHQMSLLISSCKFSRQQLSEGLTSRVVSC